MHTNEHVLVALEQRVAQGANVAQIAVAIVAAWQKIDLALGPIVGLRGVATLYRRSLYLCTLSHPWLKPLSENAGERIDLAALKALLLKQTSAAAAAGGGATLNVFRDVLASLVGRALAERLLDPAWREVANGSTSEDWT